MSDPRGTSVDEQQGYTGDAYAWALAVSPLLQILLWVILEGSGGESVEAWLMAGVLTFVVSVTLATLDARAVERRGVANVDLLFIYAAVLVPWYVVARTRAARSTPGVPMVWAVSFLVVLAFSL